MENEEKTNKSELAELLGKVMQTQEGRAFVFALLEYMFTDYPLSFGSESFMGYQIGRSGVGTELLCLLRERVEDGLQLELAMRQEARDRPRPKREDDFYEQFEGGES